MRSIQLDIRNASGLLARPAAQFVRAAQRFRSDLRVRNVRRDGAVADADAKSILGVLALGVSRGGRIEVTADGEDERQALEALRELVEGGLGEPTARTAEVVAE